MGGDYGTLKRVSEQQVVGHGVIRFTFSYPEQLPTHMVALLEQLSPEYTARASELAALPQPWELTNSVTASTIGPYLAVTATQNTYLWDDSGDTRAWYYCFDKDYQQMSLSDVFADGYAYREIIEKQLSENLNLKGLGSAYSNDEIIDDLQFTLEASAVRFCTKTILFGSGQTLYFQIPYKDFGCHNMTIFTEKPDSTTQSNEQLNELLLAGNQLHTALRPYSRYNFLSYRWMPNSEVIVISVDSGDGYQLYQVSIGGSETKKLNPSSDAQSQPFVIPDGSYIVYLNGSSKLSIYDLNKHSEVRIPFALPYRELESPIVSPDGQMIAYLHVQGGGG